MKLGYCKHHDHPSYKTWEAMKQRCDNPKNPRYEYYGGKGLRYQPDWKHFSDFVRDVGVRPSKDHVLHRIKNDEGYHKDNVVWMTKSAHMKLHAATWIY